MKTERNILIAFILNLSFSIFELFGGICTGSTAIVSDAIHDAGDAVSIGISYLLEIKSKKQPDEKYTYGYIRYSVFGGFVTSVVLLFGAVMMIYNACLRIIEPIEINYYGMIVFAIVGVCVNFCAAFFTREGGSINQKAVNLHMIEDVLGWATVLIGAVIMRFTNFVLIDPIMSIVVSCFVLINAIKNLKEVMLLFLEKVPHNIEVAKIKEYVTEINEVMDVHHIHIWSIDGQNHVATMHIVTDGKPQKIKDAIREKLQKHGIRHVTLELEASTEHCHESCCKMLINAYSRGHNHNCMMAKKE